jgi:hypothetical protein
MKDEYKEHLRRYEGECEEVIEHLEKDKNTWFELSNKALEEAESDLKLIKKLKKLI